jgi:hypothetical protein
VENIHTLEIYGYMEGMDLLGERWEPPHHLRKLQLGPRNLSAVPAWIKRNPMLYSDLSELSISVKELHQEDMKMLGRLPALRVFHLNSDNTDPLITIDGFPLVLLFKLHISAPGQMMFQPGALPRAKRVEFGLAVPVGEADRNADFDFGLRYLPTLKIARVVAICSKADKEKTESVLFQSLHNHPSAPRIDLSCRWYENSSTTS